MEGVLAELSFVLCMCLSVMRAGGGMHLAAATPTLREGRELLFFSTTKSAIPDASHDRSVKLSEWELCMHVCLQRPRLSCGMSACALPLCSQSFLHCQHACGMRLSATHAPNTYRTLCMGHPFLHRRSAILHSR